MNGPPDYGTWWILGCMVVLIAVILTALLVLMAVVHRAFNG